MSINTESKSIKLSPCMPYNGLVLTAANNYYAQKMYPDVTRSVEPFILATLVDLLYTQFREKISDAIHA